MLALLCTPIKAFGVHVLRIQHPWHYHGFTSGLGAPFGPAFGVIRSSRPDRELNPHPVGRKMSQNRQK